MNTVQSICIPRIESKITRDYIYTTFNTIKIGKIERMTEIPLRNDTKHKRVLIKIRWSQTENANNMITRLNNNETVKIIHEWPWFWRVVSTNHQII
jgi:hypothetical protein